jgi:hypothetical protein
MLCPIADNTISSGLVESLCKVNKDQQSHPVHCLCEKVAIM